ncbi:YaaL family protein [Bacillus shivajii]|uniref:YaaL family protein n=1 Tax=Bacillus shivajii TaxID=1983719 RepID=UPI001CF9C73F|nr:YaaL family protein [Bacillus shivajii]UCZ53284.1 YaaL family protein [Bacillus shivajii]
MFFRKKGKLRKHEDHQLLILLDKIKKKSDQQHSLISGSIGYHREIEYLAKIEKAKYLFLLKEARCRKTQLK